MYLPAGLGNAGCAPLRYSFTLPAPVAPALNEEGRRRLRRRPVALPRPARGFAGGGRSDSSGGWSRRCRRGGFFRLPRNNEGLVRAEAELRGAIGRREAGPWRGAPAADLCS